MNILEVQFNKENCYFFMIVFVCFQDRFKNELVLSVYIVKFRDIRIIKVIMIF